jgi:hypothetical protein
MFATLALGVVHAWVGRYAMNPDGVSYLDVGDSFFRRDWANALNAWWSPLYPWTLGLVLGLAKPSPRWEFPLVHLINFGIFVAALFAFRFLLHALPAFVRKRTSDAARNDGQALPQWALVILGYPIFLWTALQIETPCEVTPDLAVLACVCLTAGLLLRLREGDSLPKFVLFGSFSDLDTGRKRYCFQWALWLWSRVFVETLEPRLGTRNGNSRSVFSVHLCSLDLLAISPKGPVHHWRFGQGPACRRCGHC